jgi:hypothetical protein
VSSFYTKDNLSFEKKNCTIEVRMKEEGTGEKVMVASRDIDMSVYVNHSDSP